MVEYVSGPLRRWGFTSLDELLRFLRAELGDGAAPDDAPDEKGGQAHAE